jgi:hypothetical protein
VAFPDSGPPEIIALIVVGVLIVLMRWVFKPSRPRRAMDRIDASDARELGLLTVIGTVDRAAAADQRARLADAGIRASTSLRRDGRFDLLVFTQDADRAREVLQ